MAARSSKSAWKRPHRRLCDVLPCIVHTSVAVGIKIVPTSAFCTQWLESVTCAYDSDSCLRSVLLQEQCLTVVQNMWLLLQEALSGVWSRHQLFVATHTGLHCIFVAAHPDSPQPFLDVSWHILSCSGACAVYLYRLFILKLYYDCATDACH